MVVVVEVTYLLTDAVNWNGKITEVCRCCCGSQLV